MIYIRYCYSNIKSIDKDSIDKYSHEYQDCSMGKSKESFNDYVWKVRNYVDYWTCSFRESGLSKLGAQLFTTVPERRGHGIDPMKFPRSENSCGTLGIRRHEVEPSNLTDGCLAICNKPDHVHSDVRRRIRTSDLQTNYFVLTARNHSPRTSRHQYRRLDWLSIPLGTARTRIRFAASVRRETAEFMKSPEYRNSLFSSKLSPFIGQLNDFSKVISSKRRTLHAESY